MAGYTYIQITEDKYYGIVMRLGGRGDQWYWDAEKQDWVKSGLFIRYTLQEDLSDAYDEISYEEAMIIIAKQK